MDKDKIFEECSGGVWNAAEGAIEDEAELVIDMGCPLMLEEIQIINGLGDFSTKSFTVFGSQDSNGPWIQLYVGVLKQSTIEVR